MPIPYPEINLEQAVAAKKLKNSKYDPQVPKSRKTTPYQMSTRPPKQGTNTKRVVATSRTKNSYRTEIGAGGGRYQVQQLGLNRGHILNKKPKLSDKKYYDGDLDVMYKADLKDWNKVNKGVVATPNKKPTAAQKRYTTIQNRRAASLKRSK